MIKRLYKSIFLHTSLLTLPAMIVLIIYFRIVIQLTDRVFIILVLLGVCLAIVAVALSMLIHFVDLKPYLKYLSLPPSERFPDPKEWLKVDKALADYPWRQAIGTMIIWFVGALVVSIVSYFYKNYMNLAEAVYTSVGGLFMGGICGGYNYFFFKIDLAPIRKELAPPEPPTGWVPLGSVRKLLSTAFFSTFMALVVFPCSVLYHRMDILRRETIKAEGKVAIEFIEQSLREGITDERHASVLIDKWLEKKGRGKFFLLDGSGKLLHGIRVALSELALKRMLAESDGFVAEADKVIVFRHLGNIIGGVVYSKADMRKGSLRLFGFMFLVVILSVMLAVGLIVLSRQYISSALAKIAKEVEAVAEGDLERQIAVCSDGEIGILEKSLSVMKRKLVALLGSQQRIVERVGTLIGSLSRMAEYLSETASQQNAVAREQAVSAQEALAASEEIVAGATQISDSAVNVAGTAQNTLRACSEGMESGNKAAEGIENLKKDVEEIASRMTQLREAGEKITKIVDIILELADKTRLLALNAGLEAVGAGKMGKRFAVVAGEVKRLADRASSAGVEIGEIVKELDKHIEETFEATKSGTQSASTAVALLDGLLRALNKISTFASETSASAQDISASTKQQTGASRELGATILRVNEFAGTLEMRAQQLEKTAEELKELTIQLSEIAGDT